MFSFLGVPVDAAYHLVAGLTGFLTPVLGGLLAMLTGLLHDLIQLAASPSGLTALAGTVLAGAMLAAVLALLISVAGRSRKNGTVPMIRRASALREKSWRAAFLRQRDPDAAGRPRPRAPSAAPAAALPC